MYCSRTKSAIVAEKSGHTMAFYLAPFSSKRHGGGPSNSSETIGFGTGVRLPGCSASVAVCVAEPSRAEEAVPPESCRSAEARHDMRPLPPPYSHLPRLGIGLPTSRLVSSVNITRRGRPASNPTLWSGRRACLLVHAACPVVPLMLLTR